MFSKGGLLFGLAVAVLVGVIAYLTDGMYLTLAEGWQIQLHLELVWTCAFIAAFFFVVLFVLALLVGGLVGLPGLGRGEEEEHPVTSRDFTVGELQAMDREEEPHWNESQRQQASASWQGGYNHPTYEDYRGNLRDALTNEFIHDNHTDRRRVVNGKRVPQGRRR